MTHLAAGTFTISMAPPPAGEGGGRLSVGRMLIDKHYTGELRGSGQGEMLSAGNPAAGAAGYVAIEHITGTLHGRSGSFALQHSGAMHDGHSELSIAIVPGSGTGELLGIAGTCKLDFADGQHAYELAYTLS
jgi:hypothetical protein